ncbi:hypothetical protein AB1J05_01715 [Staphylococcus cohnii species complex 1658]|uniref:hypothetical protein n=1 Tax=Staphylococcus cohnii species complex 1658 TaxID=3239424 RepID=UPI0034D9610E
MTEENKYVLRHEWERSRGKLNERINEVDKKHTDAINTLNNKVDKQTLLQEKAFESQERSEKHLEKLSDTMTTFGEDFGEIKYKVRSHEEKLVNFQGIIDEKQKGNAQITGIIITGIFSVIVAAIGAAQLFF